MRLARIHLVSGVVSTVLLLMFNGVIRADEERTVAPRHPRIAGTEQTPATLFPRDAVNPARDPWFDMDSALHAAPERIAALIEWNNSHRVPWQNGFSRGSGPRREIQLQRWDLSRTPVTAADGIAYLDADDDLVWRGWLRVRDARALRLRLSAVVPEGARVDIRSLADGVWQRVRSGSESSWTPTLAGSAVELRISLPADRLRATLNIDELFELFASDESGAPATRSAATGCTLDISCVDADATLSWLSRAIGRIQFSSGGKSYVCTGGLVGDAEGSDIPYLLTAHHCISTAAEASSVEVTWNYKTSSCGGFQPNPATLPRSLGATLLATRGDTDVTLLRLTSIPSNRSFLGWTTSAPGTSLLRRISHPGGGPQAYSESFVATSVSTVCSDAPRPLYLYEDPWRAGIAGGSSGAPVWIDDGLVVGQLSGTCGGSDCGPDTDTLDGRFARSYPYLQPWLDPTAGPSAPTGLRTTRVGKKHVALAWSDTSGDELRFEIWRSKGNGPASLAGTTGPDTTAFDVRGLRRSTRYTFALQACRDSGCSVPVTLSTRTKR